MIRIAGCTRCMLLGTEEGVFSEAVCDFHVKEACVTTVGRTGQFKQLVFSHAVHF